jgi:hypothetical protein
MRDFGAAKTMQDGPSGRPEGPSCGSRNCETNPERPKLFIGRFCMTTSEHPRSAGHAVFALAGLLSLLIWPTISCADAPADDTFGDPEQIRRDIDEILAQPEFRRLRVEAPQPPSRTETPEWLKKFFDWLGNLLSKTGGAVSGLGVILQSLAYAVLAVIVALIIWLVVRAVNRYRARHNTGLRGRSYEEGEADLPPGDLPADEYLRRAMELAERGMFREAIAQLILGAMSFTERNGLIRFRRGLTHRDYLRALRGRAEPHQALRTIVGVYEPICFGRRPAHLDHYRTSLDGYQTGFRRPLGANSEIHGAPGPAVAGTERKPNPDDAETRG